MTPQEKAVMTRKLTCTENRRFGRAARLFAAGAVLFAAACTDDTGTPIDPGTQTPTSAIEVHTTPKPQFSQVTTSAPIVATCGPTSTYAMWSNPYVPGGSVTISNDAENIYVTYNISNPDWYLTDSRLAVEKDKSKIPMENATTPSPWEFSLAGVHDPAVHAFTYTIKLSSIGARAGETVYAAVMAGVVYPVTGNYEGDWEWRTAWAVPQNKTSPLIQSYVVQSCGGSTTPPPPPPDTTTTTPPPPPPPTTKGRITITFDDGWAETYTMIFPILKGLGIVANSAVNPEPIDGHWSAYMTLAQVKELKAAGWSIESHSVSHPDLTKLNATQLDAELKNSKDWIAKNNLGSSPMFIVPFHSWGARERTAIQKYYKGARGYTVDQFWPEKYVAWPITTPYDITAFEPEYAPFTTADGRALTMSKIQYAVDNGKFLDIFFHHVTQQQKAAFTTLMTDIANKYKANIVTYDGVF
jgi:peptidoglycan/xylan/chitin deacetylase (PgdA/CDA1 family)